MKYSLGISNFLEVIPSLSHSVVFLYFFALITEEGFLSLLAILWNFAFRCLYLSFSPLLFTSLLFTAIVWPPRQPFCFFTFLFLGEDFPGGSDSKASAYSAGDLGSIPGEGNGNPLQYSCLENPMDRGAWWATVNGVTKSRTRLSNFTFTHILGLAPCLLYNVTNLRP